MASPQYIAGFFDGEGSVGLYANGRGTYHLRVQIVQNVTQASSELFDELKVLYGGAWCPRKGKKSANWQLSGANAESFLKEIQPYVRLKKDQVNLALDWLATKEQPSRDEKGRMRPYTRKWGDRLMAQTLKDLKRKS